MVGQTPVTDGSYSRIEGRVFLHRDGSVTTQTWGDGVRPDDDENLVIQYRVPISRTVESNGTLREGNPKVLDVALPHNHEQYFNNDAHLANAAFSRIEELATP